MSWRSRKMKSRLQNETPAAICTKNRPQTTRIPLSQMQKACGERYFFVRFSGVRDSAARPRLSKKPQSHAKGTGAAGGAFRAVWRVRGKRPPPNRNPTSLPQNTAFSKTKAGQTIAACPALWMRGDPPSYFWKNAMKKTAIGGIERAPCHSSPPKFSFPAPTPKRYFPTPRSTPEKDRCLRKRLARFAAHDRFRGVPEAFAPALRRICARSRAGPTCRPRP